jgi:predicted Zn-dependent protease
MRRTLRVVSVLFIVAYLISCARVPISNRRQVNLLGENQLISMSLGAYSDFLSQHTVLSESDQRVKMVRRIGDKIRAASEKYLRDNDQSKRVEGFQWEFNVVEENTVNAWCMPGGKVVVYTGILPVTQDETSLAVVMGHEIAHAIARHGNERMSQGLIINASGAVLSVLLEEKPQLAQDIFFQAYGLGSTLGMLAYSRTHETEADKLGLVFMAMAGYDPRASVGFWERMSAASQGGAMPEILSTHPSDETRINTLKEFMPEALKYYTPGT